jgi:hypothetical protein
MGFYILPKAGNKAATTYKGQGKDTCKVVRIKSNVDEQHWSVYKSTTHPLMDSGVTITRR